MRSIFALALAATVVLATASAVPAFEKELAAYGSATVHICDDGVTPEMEAKYQTLVAAVDDAHYGFGRTASPSNFWGPTSPKQLFSQCHQMGGDGAGGDGADGSGN
jgi:hypothetical protein